MDILFCFCCCSVAKPRLTLCNPMVCSTQGFPCPSPSPRVCSNSCPLSRWCYLTISSSAVLHSLPGLKSLVNVCSTPSPYLHRIWIGSGRTVSAPSTRQCAQEGAREVNRRATWSVNIYCLAWQERKINITNSPNSCELPSFSSLSRLDGIGRESKQTAFQIFLVLVSEPVLVLSH